LGQATNALRDLDVYLLHQAGYQAMLPEPLRPAIGPLFKTLQKNRIREKAKINALLDAPAYHDLVARLRDGGGLQGPSGGAGLFTGDLSRRLIFKLFKKTIKMGRSMVAGATDQALHGLRIQCKKLRYAIEFFVSLMDADQAGLLIGQLKSLQDYLGRVNDLAVQQRFLFAYLQTIPARAADRLALSAAVGALIGGLYREQGQLRTGFADVFGRFDTKGNRRCYRRLFGPRQALP
jgi:CHAD domain-containing protein